jgi:hypothetical protein
MKLKELLKGRKKLSEYDDLVSRIRELHLAHVRPMDINNIDKILEFEEHRASAIAKYKAEITKLDEE